MDVVKQNQFWFGVGGVVLLALILGGVFIGGLKSEASALSSEIQNNGSRLDEFKTKGQELPTAAWADQANADLASMQKMRQDITKHLSEQGSTALNRWFKELTVREGETPSLDDFKPLYLRATDALKKDLEDKNIRVGPPKKKTGFGAATEEEGGFERIAEPGPNMIRSLMKHYWIQKRLADVVAETNPQALLNVKFKDDPSAAVRAPSGAPGGTPTPAPVTPSSLPLGLGVIIEFEVTLELYYPEVTTFVASFLKMDKDLPLFTRVKRLQVQKTTTPPEKKEVKIPSEEADDPKWQNLQPDRIPVKLILVGEVLDFAPVAK